MLHQMLVIKFKAVNNVFCVMPKEKKYEQFQQCGVFVSASVFLVIKIAVQIFTIFVVASTLEAERWVLNVCINKYV